jgi:hypothetical protein
VDTIKPGVDFVKSLDEPVAECIAFIAVIGPRWLTVLGNDGNPRGAAAEAREMERDSPGATTGPEKNIGRISQRFAHFLQELRRLFIQCKDLKTLTISTPRYV